MATLGLRFPSRITEHPVHIFDYVPKVLNSGGILGMIALVVVPVYITYLCVPYDAGYVKMVVVALTFMICWNLIFAGVVIHVEAFLNSGASTHRRLVKWVLKISMFFINHGQNFWFYGAMSFIVTVVSVIGAYWEKDPSTFTKGSLEGLIVVLLTELKWKTKLDVWNVICTGMAICVCLGAIWAEDGGSGSFPARAKTAVVRGFKAGLKKILHGGDEDRDPGSMV